MKVDLNKWYRCKVDKETYKSLTKKSDYLGLRHVLTWLFFLILIGYFAFITWGTLWSFFWFFIYGNIFMASDPIRHDCQHNLAFKSKWLNTFFYQLTSFMFSYEAVRWRWSHFRHHSHTLSVEGIYDHEIQITKPTDLFLVLLMHIPGGNILIIHKTFLFFHLETIKHAIGIVTPIMEDCIPAKERSKCQVSARIHVSLWILIIGSSIFFQTWLPALYLLLPFVYGTTFMQTIHFMQHAGLKNNVKDHRLSVRTVKLNPIFSFLNWNMEYHLEHHMFPNIPAYNLKKLNKVIKDQLPKPKEGILEAYREIIPTLIKQAKDPYYILNINLPKT